MKNESLSPQLSSRVGKPHVGGLGLPRKHGDFFAAERGVFSPDTGSRVSQCSVLPSELGPLQGVGMKWLNINSNTCRAAAAGRRDIWNDVGGTLESVFPQIGGECTFTLDSIWNPKAYTMPLPSQGDQLFGFAGNRVIFPGTRGFQC